MSPGSLLWTRSYQHWKPTRTLQVNTAIFVCSSELDSISIDRHSIDQDIRDQWRKVRQYPGPSRRRARRASAKRRRQPGSMSAETTKASPRGYGTEYTENYAWGQPQTRASSWYVYPQTPGNTRLSPTQAALCLA